MVLQCISENNEVLPKLNEFLDSLSSNPNYKEINQYLITYLTLSSLFTSKFKEQNAGFDTTINDIHRQRSITLYRGGIFSNSEIYSTFKQNSLIFFNSYLITTTHEEIIKKYLSVNSNHERVIFKMTIPLTEDTHYLLKSIAEYSKFEEDQEVLLCAGSNFKVVGIE